MDPDTAMSKQSLVISVWSSAGSLGLHLPCLNLPPNTTDRNDRSVHAEPRSL